MKFRARDIISKNYNSYIDAFTDEKEAHWRRLLCQIAISLLVPFTFRSFSDDSISVAVTAISILMGFAFSAMFPIADTHNGLPKPVFSEDRDDLQRIRKLSTNFRHNVGYFIPLSLSCIAILLSQMFSIECLDFFRNYCVFLETKSKFTAGGISVIQFALNRSAMAISTFLILEIGYTFYRMTANALYVIRIREEYRDGHFDRGSNSLS